MSGIVGRGAQVRLDGEQQRIARGAAGPTLLANNEAKRLLELSGSVSDGLTPDGSSPLGVPPEDEVLVPEGTDPSTAMVPLADVVALAARVTALELEVEQLREEMDELNRRYA